MEKYSKWKDPATGIMPFVPHKEKRKRNQGAGEKVVSVIKTFLLGPILLLLRLPVVAVLGLSVFLLANVLPLVPGSPVRRFLTRLLEAPLYRLLLLFLGFHIIPTRTVNPRQRFKAIDGTPGADIHHGDLLLVNCVSYIQPLYLAFRFSPTFVWPVRDQGRSDYGVVCGVFDIIKAMVTDQGPDVSKAQPLAAILKHAQASKQGPVVLFPEGTTTNGLEIVRFLDCLTESVLATNPRIHIAAFKFETGPAAHSPALPVGMLWKGHLCRVLMSVNNTMAVSYCDPGSVPSLAPRDPNRRVGTVLAAQESDEVEKIMASMFQMHVAIIGIAEKIEFLKYFQEKEFKGYGSKKSK